jgi:hypothetical protein
LSYLTHLDVRYGFENTPNRWNLRNSDLRGAGLVVSTPVVLVDGELALGSGAPWSTASFRGGALGAPEVERLGKNNVAR